MSSPSQPPRRLEVQRCVALGVASMVLTLAASSALAQAAASAPPLVFKAESDAAVLGPQQWLTATLLCLLGLAVAVWWLRRRTGLGTPLWSSPTPRALAVVERIALTPNTQLLVVDHADRRLLLSVGPTGTQMLRDGPRPDRPSPPDATPVSGDLP